MRRLLAIGERVTGALAIFAGALAALLLLAMTAIVAYGVALRYLFNKPQVWGDELVGYLIVLLVMLAAAEVLRRGEHIAIDVLTEKLPVGIRTWIEIAGMAVVVLVSAVLIVSGLDVAEFSWTMGVRSVGYLAVPMWLPLMSMPLGFALLGLAALNRLVRLLVGLDTLPEAKEGPHL